MPALVWNMMMSMSGGWFFVVAAEAISVGDTTVTLPGIGSYIALAIDQRDLAAIGWAIGAMLIVILLYDQLLFRPLVAWADRFRFEQEAGDVAPRSWVLTVLRRSGLVARLVRAAGRSVASVLPGPAPARRLDAGSRSAAPRRDGPTGSGRARSWSSPRWRSGRSTRFVLEGLSVSEVAARPRPGHGDAGPRPRPDRAGQRDLGADRRLGGHAAAAGADRPADRAVPGGLSGQPALSGRGLGDRRLPARTPTSG